MNTIPVPVSLNEDDPIGIKSPSITSFNLQNSLSQALPGGRLMRNLT